jgi:hypothetical protein
VEYHQASKQLLLAFGFRTMVQDDDELGGGIIIITTTM